jgi:hypothetical protein
MRERCWRNGGGDGAISPLPHIAARMSRARGVRAGAAVSVTTS